MLETVEIEHSPCEGAEALGAAGWTWRKQVKAPQLTMDRSWLRPSVRKIPWVRRLFELRRQVRRARKLASNPRFLLEGHHYAYGRPWCYGRDQFNCLIARGLKPNHRLLDLGCGSLRTGIWLIPFLDKGNYFGIESHLDSLLAAKEYEIPLHNLAGKRPQLLHDTNFRISHFGVKFDWIVAFSVLKLKYLDESQLEMAYRSIAEGLAPDDGKLLTNRPSLSVEKIESRCGLRLVDHGSTGCRLIKSDVKWFEFHNMK